MVHTVEMWVEGDGDKRLLCIEGDVDLSQWPERFVVSHIKGYLPEHKVEVNLTNEEVAHAANMMKEMFKLQHEQLDWIKFSKQKKEMV